MDERQYLNEVADALDRLTPDRSTLRRLAERAGLDSSLVLDNGLVQDSIHRLVRAAGQSDEEMSAFLEQALHVFPKVELPERVSPAQSSKSVSLRALLEEVASVRAEVSDALRTRPTLSGFEIDDLYSHVGKAQILLDTANTGDMEPAHTAALLRLGEACDRTIESLHHLRGTTELVESEDDVLVPGGTEADRTAAQLMRRRELTNARTHLAQSLAKVAQVCNRVENLL